MLKKETKYLFIILYVLRAIMEGFWDSEERNKVLFSLSNFSKDLLYFLHTHT